MSPIYSKCSHLKTQNVHDQTRVPVQILHFRHPTGEPAHTPVAAREQRAPRGLGGAPKRGRAHYVQVSATHELPRPHHQVGQEPHQPAESKGENFDRQNMP